MVYAERQGGSRQKLRGRRKAVKTPVYRVGSASLSDRREISPESGPAGASTEEGNLKMYCWNIGGKPIESAIAAIVNSHMNVEKAIFAFQELPREPPGWRTKVMEDHTLVQYRGEDQWRGNGICFPTSEYSCIRRRGSELGIWVRLRHLETGREMWFCSARLSTGVTDDVTADECQRLLCLRPPTGLPSVILADFNTQLRWTGAAGRFGQPLPTSGRADFLMAELEKVGYGLRAPAPEQWNVPTSRPRRRGALGRQIDGVATKGTRRPDVVICEGSYKQIAGDHDRLEISLPVGRTSPMNVALDTRPRASTGKIPPQTGLNQTRIEQLAVEFTRPYVGKRYRDPAAVKRAFREARRENTEEAWKKAQLARRAAVMNGAVPKCTELVKEGGKI